MIDGDPWMQLVLLALVIPLLATLKGGVRTIAVTELLPEWKARRVATSGPGYGLHSCAFGFVSVWRGILLRIGCDQTDSMARHSLRTDLAEHHADSKTLATGF